MKGGETLALNERIMLSLVSTGVSTFYFENVISLPQNKSSRVFLYIKI